MNKVSCDNTNCKIPRTNKHIKCTSCDAYFCSEKCMKPHRCKNEISPDSKPPMYLKRKTTISSKFIKPGKILKELKNDPNYQFSNFEIVKIGKNPQILGNGLHGDIYLSRNKKNNKLFAIKQMNKAKIKENNVSDDIIENEINIHIKLIHDNIVRLHTFHVTSDSYYLIMDYCPNGTLDHILKKNKFLDERNAFRYFIQIASAVNFLHENNLVHRDIKPENCLIEDNNVIKLCDFGWCCELSLGNRISFCGTYEYMAPEVMNEMPYNHSVDMWSLGVLLYEMLQGVSPFKPSESSNSDENYNEILRKINQNNITFEKAVSKNCEDLIRKMLSLDKNSRIKIKEVFSHPWVVGFEKELKEDVKIHKSIDSMSTNHNSSTSANSVKEYHKQMKKQKDHRVHKYNEAHKVDENELKSFCLLENNDSIFDRVLGKVNEKNKYKSQRNEKLAELHVLDNEKSTGVDNSKLIKTECKTPSNARKDNMINNTEGTNFNLLDEIKNDIESFNQIVNPKTLKIPEEELENDDERIETKKIHKMSSQKNVINCKNSSFLINDHPLLSETPNPDDSDQVKQNKRISDFQSYKKLEFTPDFDLRPKKKNNLEDKKNYLAALEILEKAHSKTNIINDKKQDENGFWSFLNPFKCGKCD